MGVVSFAHREFGTSRITTRGTTRAATRMAIYLGFRSVGGGVHMTDRQALGFGLDGVLLAVAAVVLAVGTVVWGGAALAAAVAGGDLDGGLSAALRAAMRLAEEWREPRMAWERPADQEALPGPALYWAATLVVALAAAGVAAVGMRVWRASRDRGRVR